MTVSVSHVWKLLHSVFAEVPLHVGAVFAELNWRREMRSLFGALLATLFAVGLSGAALANCPHSHDKTQSEATEDSKTS